MPLGVHFHCCWKDGEHQATIAQGNRVIALGHAVTAGGCGEVPGQMLATVEQQKSLRWLALLLLQLPMTAGSQI